MSKDKSNSGIGFVWLLTIVFIILKICDVIEWSWWWVLSPIWISGLITGIILTIILIVVTCLKDK